MVFQSSEKATVSWDSETKTAALIIKTVGLDDSGKYTCIAYSDVGGHAMTTVAVQVRGIVDLILVKTFYNQMSMPRKCHTYRSQTNQRHHEEKTQEDRQTKTHSKGITQ